MKIVDIIPAIIFLPVIVHIVEYAIIVYIK